jgi:hypothetical protein
MIMTAKMVRLSVLAENYGISFMTAKKYANAGRILGAVKIGNKWQVPEDAQIISDDEAAKNITPALVDPVIPATPVKTLTFNELYDKVARGVDSIPEGEQFTKLYKMHLDTGMLVSDGREVLTREQLENREKRRKEEWERKEQAREDEISNRERILGNKESKIDDKKENAEQQLQIAITAQAILQQRERQLIQREHDLDELAGKVKTVAIWCKRVKARIYETDPKKAIDFPKEVTFEDMAHWGEDDYYKEFKPLELTSPDIDVEEEPDELEPDETDETDEA